MRTTQLTAALPPLSVIALGTAEYGSRIPEAAAFALLDAYAAGGGTVLDTANCYAEWLPDGEGRSERTIGNWPRTRPSTHMVISTKGGHPRMSSMDQSRLCPADLNHDLTQSLARLQVDQVGLYWLHRDDESIPVGELVDWLEGQRHRGRIAAYGASNWSTARLDAAAAFARTYHCAGFCADQPGWSLAERRSDMPTIPGCSYGDADLLAWHRRTGLGTMAYTSQARGWFTKDVADYDTPANRARRLRAEHLASKSGSTANRVALAWLTNQPFPGIAIVGPNRMDQLSDCLAAGEVVLSAHHVTWLANG